MTKRLIKNSKLSNRQIHKLIGFFVLEVSASKAAGSLKINRHSAERVYTFIRTNLAIECEKHSPFDGEVEVDESYFGGLRKGKRGRGAKGKAMIFIAAQVINNHIGRIRLCQIDDASAISLEAAVQKTITPGAIVHTDAWNGYNNIQNLGYTHRIVRKDSSVGKNLLPKANRVASLLKRWLLGTHQGAVKSSHLDYYLCQRRLYPQNTIPQIVQRNSMYFHRHHHLQHYRYALHHRTILK